MSACTKDCCTPGTPENDANHLLEDLSEAVRLARKRAGYLSMGAVLVSSKRLLALSKLQTALKGVQEALEDVEDSI